MAPIMPLNVPSAGGSKSAIAACVATRYPSMRWASVACSPGVATSSTRRMEPCWQDSCSKPELVGILTACPRLAGWYQLSNDHGHAPSFLRWLFSERMSQVASTTRLGVTDEPGKNPSPPKGARREGKLVEA